MFIMATKATQIHSPSKNWKKHWRYASSPTNYSPKSPIKVCRISGSSLRPNERAEIKRIDTGYQGSAVLGGNSPIIPDYSGFATRKKISKFRRALYDATQTPESREAARHQVTASKDPRLDCRKRPAESSPLSDVKQRGQQSAKQFKTRVTKSEYKCNSHESLKRKTEIRPLESPQNIRPKILRLQEKYYAEKLKNHQTTSIAFKEEVIKESSQTRQAVLNKSDEAQHNGQSYTVSEKQQPGQSWALPPGLNESFWSDSEKQQPGQSWALPPGLDESYWSASEKCHEPHSPNLDYDGQRQWSKNFDEWYNSLRPSLSEVILPVITPENTMRLNLDDKGKTVVLGQGVYGFVTRGELGIGSEKHDCVIKTFRPSKSDREMVLEEARILHYLANTGVVPKLFGVLESKDPTKLPAVVQECFANGQDFYKLIDKKTTPKKDWVNICVHAAEGLLKIHSKQVLINDIKPDNILVDDNNNIKFIDFGMATLIEGFFYTVGPEVEKCFQIAPECRKGEETTYRSDIFSFGIVLKSVGNEADIPELTVLSKLLTCAEPFERINIFDTIRRLKELADVM